jgi:hypothetical protein
MAKDNDRDEARWRAHEIARYRLAAEQTLEQLKWCVNYLNRIRKRRIAEVIDKPPQRPPTDARNRRPKRSGHPDGLRRGGPPAGVWGGRARAA